MSYLPTSPLRREQPPLVTTREPLTDDEVITLDSLTTLQGDEISIEVTSDGVILNGTVKIITTDIVTSNGIIHVIDAVLLPPSS